LGDKWDFGQVPMVSSLLLIFLNFFEDRKIDKLHGSIVFFSIGAPERKLYPNKFKTRGEGATKKYFKNLN